MNTDKDYMLLADIIAMHNDGRIFGRKRLQKSIKLLQKTGFPTKYSFKNYFYGPYSDEIQEDISLLEEIGILEETKEIGNDGNSYYIISSKSRDPNSSLSPFSEAVDILQNTETVTLELAATYDSFRDMGYNHENSLEKLRMKKKSIITMEKELDSLKLLDELDIDCS